MNWFEKRRRTKGLDLAYDTIVKALDTIVLLNKTVKSYSEGKKAETKEQLDALFAAEEEVDKLRTEAFKELSQGSALVADYREDLLHLVKRLDMAADSAKDAGRCVGMLSEAKLPADMLKQTVAMTDGLVEAAQTLKSSINAISSNPAEAVRGAHRVQDIEHEIDKGYLETKKLFVKFGDQVNGGALVVFDDMIEFIEQAADLCADTADYIIVLSSRE